MTKRPAARAVHLLLIAGLGVALTGCFGPRSDGPVVPPTAPRPTMPKTSPPAPVTGQWPPTIALEAVAPDAFDKPVHVTNAGDGSDRLFVVEQPGRIRIIEADGDVAAQPFLDITDRVRDSGERGLLSVAFPPDYPTAGVIYVDYTDAEGDTVISRFRTTDGQAADRSSEEILLRIDQPYSNHNGGQILFDTEGLLLIGMGDGGSAGDPENRAQDTRSLLGKILRIDVGHAVPEVVSAPRGAYAVPTSNPYADGQEGAPEIWMLGLRNPWRFSIDPQTGEVWIGDVGQNAVEEITVVSKGRGANLGWNLYEGSRPYPPGSKERAIPGGHVGPVVEYDRSQGKSVTGGLVYRGSDVPGLYRAYVYADYVTGRLWAVRANADGSWDNRLLLESGLLISSFGEDEDGELYVCDHGSGSIMRIAGD